MRLRIDPRVLVDFPDAVIAVVVARGVENGRRDPAVVEILGDAESKARARLGEGSLSDHPHIAVWREAYRRFGARPKKHLSSVENLARRIQKGERVRPIHPLVDLYNAVSLRHLVPVGGEDLERIEGDIVLTVAGDDELPVVLLGESEARPPQPGEIIYRDDRGAICRRWNWKEAERTKLTESTRQAALFIEGLPPLDRSCLERAAADLSELVERFCGGSTVIHLLDRENPIAELDRD